MPKRTIFLWLFIILIIASFLRLYHFTATPPGLYPDEAADGNNALEVTHTTPFWSGLKAFYPEDNGREGLYVNIVAVLIKALGGIHEPWVVRLPAAISGILTVLGIYFLARELFDYEIRNEYEYTKEQNNRDSYIRNKFVIRREGVALLAAFFLATSFWHINFSRIGFRAIMAPLFLTWSVYLLVKGFKKLEGGAPFGRATALHIFGGILFGLGLYSYIAYRVSPALVLLIFIFYWLTARKGGWQKKFFHSAAHFLLFSAIVFLPLGYYFYSHPGSFFGRTSQISILNSESPLRDLAMNSIKTLAMFNIRGDLNWRHNISGAPELFWPVGFMFLIGIIIAIKNISTKSEAQNPKEIRSFNGKNSNLGNWNFFRISNFGFILLFSWFILAMLPVVISDEGIPHALRSILMIPPVIIFAAFGGYAVYERLRRYIRPSRLKALSMVFIVLLALEAYSSYFIVWATNPNVPAAFNADYVALGHELNVLPAKTPKYVVVEASGVPIRGIPTPAQTTMFITDTFRLEEQTAKNIHYFLPRDKGMIPGGASIFYIR